MPKMKSNRGAAKRFKITATGKVKHKRTLMRHHQTHKTRARKRHLRRPGTLIAIEAREVHRLLPYG